MENHTTTEVPVTVHWQDAAPAEALGGLFPILLMFAIFCCAHSATVEGAQGHEAMVGTQEGRQSCHQGGRSWPRRQRRETTVDLEVADKVRITIEKMSGTKEREGG